MGRSHIELKGIAAAHGAPNGPFRGIGHNTLNWIEGGRA